MKTRRMGVLSRTTTLLVAVVLTIATLIAAQQSTITRASALPNVPTTTTLSWLTGARLTGSQLAALGLDQGTHCVEDPYTRVVSLHDGDGPELISLGMAAASTSASSSLLAETVFGVPPAYQGTYGRLAKVGNKLVIDAFAAQFYIRVQRPTAGRSLRGHTPQRTTNATPSATTTQYHHLSRIEITCRSPIYKVSCEARYFFMRPNSRLLNATLVAIHPLEGRTTSPLGAMSAAIASALTSTAAVGLSEAFLDDLATIEYLSFYMPSIAYPCDITEHWLRTIPVYVESTVLEGLAAAIGGDTTSRVGMTPTVVAGAHLQVRKDTPNTTTSTSATTTSSVPAAYFALNRVRIVDDRNPTRLDDLKGATFILVAFIVLTIIIIVILVYARRSYISVFREAWSAPDGQVMIFGNSRDDSEWGANASAAVGDEDGAADDDEEDEESEEGEEEEEEETEGEDEGDTRGETLNAKLKR